MSRSGYDDDCDGWQLNCWRGAVASAIRGRRGQALLKEMLTALDAMTDKRLITHHLIRDGEVCALGAVGLARGLRMDAIDIDIEDCDQVAREFGIALALAAEISYMNDEAFRRVTPEERHLKMRQWAVDRIGDKGIP